MDKDLKLVNVKSSQIQELQDICCQVYTINFGDHWIGSGLADYLTQQFGTAQLERDLQDPDILYYFLLYQKQNVGFLKVRLGGSLEGLALQQAAEIEKMYLLPDFKGKSLGGRAMEQIIEILKKKAIQLIFLYVIDTNLDAITFYQKMKFTIHAPSRLEAPQFKDELRGMYIMTRFLE